MKNNGTKKNISKIPKRDNNIKVKKKSQNNTNIIKQYDKSNRNKEIIFNRTSFNTNSNFYTITDFIPKNLTNKNTYKTLIQAKRTNLNVKNKNKINDFEKINYKYYINPKSSNPINLKESKKISILQDKSKENISNNFPKEIKDLRQSFNSNKFQRNKMNNNGKIKDIHLITEKANNSFEKIKQIMEMSSIITINNNPKIKNQKNIKGNKTNIKPFDQINNNYNSFPLNMNEINNIRKKILPIKKNNSTTNSKYEINNNNNQNRIGNNSYYSCYNFYQKDNNSNNNTNKNNYNYNKMLNTINNFEFHNYSNIYQIEGKMSEKNKNKSKNYILYEKENINLHKEKPKIIKNKNLIPRSDYKKYAKNRIYTDKKNNNNNKIHILEKFLNKDKNKLIEYKKKLIQYFCKVIEDFIFMSVKRNFKYFINNLNQFSVEKKSNYLLLKRLQNKAIQKNFYKEKGKTSLYNYLNPIENNSNYIDIIRMNNSNIINTSKKDDNIPRDFSKGYAKKRNIYNLNRTQSPSLMEYFNRNNEYFERTNYNLDIIPDIENKENLNNLNRNIFNGDKKLNYNKINLDYSKRNNLINENINFDFSPEYRKSETYIQNHINNKNVYVPKKFKLINNSKISPITNNENNNNSNNNSYVSSPLMNYELSHNIFSKKLSHNKKFNQSHELYNDPVKSKIANKKFSPSDHFHKKYNTSSNYYNSNFNIYKENNIEFLNNTNDNSIQRNSRIISGKTFNTEINERNPIYQKKLKVNKILKMYSKPKSTRIRNQILDINLHLNNHSNESISQFLSPNIEKNTYSNMIINPNTDIVPKQSSFLSNFYNYNNIRIAQTEPRRELYSNNNIKNKFGNIKELTVNLSKKNNNEIKESKDNIFIYSRNDFDNCLVKESENNNNNNDELYNENILINETNEKSYENFINEIIIKDVSSSDRRLNVFIKYIEMRNINDITKEKLSYDVNLLKYIHIDSLTIQGTYPKKTMLNIYYKNYCYGNKLNANKIKFNKILSSIMEEEEKSKAAGSINNSTISDEDNSKTINNYSHFFIQSVKYFSDLLQSIFEDKKKDFYHKFFKILKKIKNEAFLQGLMNEKKYQTLNQSKIEKKEEEKEDKEEKEKENI